MRRPKVGAKKVKAAPEEQHQASSDTKLKKQIETISPDSSPAVINDTSKDSWKEKRPDIMWRNNYSLTHCNSPFLYPRIMKRSLTADTDNSGNLHHDPAARDDSNQATPQQCHDRDEKIPN
jgi:hypothetical protein